MKNEKGGSLRDWVPVIILFIAILLSFAIFYARTQQYKSWEPTPGVVTEIKLFSSHGGGKAHLSSRSHRIYFAYSVAGQSYTGYSQYSGYDSESAAGDAVTVWYDPDCPSQSSFNKPTPGLDPIAPFILGLPLMIGSWAANRRRRDSHPYGKRLL